MAIILIQTFKLIEYHSNYLLSDTLDIGHSDTLYRLDDILTHVSNISKNLYYMGKCFDDMFVRFWYEITSKYVYVYGQSIDSHPYIHLLDKFKLYLIVVLYHLPKSNEFIFKDGVKISNGIYKLGVGVII